MADYTSGTLSLYGTIQTVQHLSDLVDMIVTESPYGAVTEKHMSDDLAVYEEIMATLSAEPKAYDTLTFRDDELAGGEMDGVYNVARNAMMPYVATWSGCRAFDAGMLLWHPEHGDDRCTSDEDGVPLLSIGELRTALTDEIRPIGAVYDLKARYERFEGKGFPPIGISDEVRSFIEKELAGDDA